MSKPLFGGFVPEESEDSSSSANAVVPYKQFSSAPTLHAPPTKSSAPPSLLPSSKKKAYWSSSGSSDSLDSDSSAESSSSARRRKRKKRKEERKRRSDSKRSKRVDKGKKHRSKSRDSKSRKSSSDGSHRSSASIPERHPYIAAERNILGTVRPASTFFSDTFLRKLISAAKDGADGVHDEPFESLAFYDVRPDRDNLLYDCADRTITPRYRRTDGVDPDRERAASWNKRSYALGAVGSSGMDPDEYLLREERFGNIASRYYAMPGVNALATVVKSGSDHRSHATFSDSAAFIPLHPESNRSVDLSSTRKADSYSSGARIASTTDDEVTRTNASFSQRLRLDPENVREWLAYVRFQRVYGQHFGLANGIIRERQALILSRAIDACPSSFVLLEAYALISSVANPPETTLHLYESLLLRYPYSAEYLQLALHALTFYTSRVTTFSTLQFSDVRDWLQSHILFRVRDQSLLNAPFRDLADFDRHLVTVMLMYWRVEWAAGYKARCIAQLVAVLERNCLEYWRRSEVVSPEEYGSSSYFDIPASSMDELFVESDERFADFWTREYPRLGYANISTALSAADAPMNLQDCIAEWTTRAGSAPATDTERRRDSTESAGVDDSHRSGSDRASSWWLPAYLHDIPDAIVASGMGGSDSVEFISWQCTSFGDDIAPVLCGLRSVRMIRFLWYAVIYALGVPAVFDDAMRDLEPLVDICLHAFPSPETLSPTSSPAHKRWARNVVSAAVCRFPDDRQLWRAYFSVHDIVDPEAIMTLLRRFAGNTHLYAVYADVTQNARVARRLRRVLPAGDVALETVVESTALGDDPAGVVRTLQAARADDIRPGREIDEMYRQWLAPLSNDQPHPQHQSRRHSGRTYARQFAEAVLYKWASLPKAEWSTRLVRGTVRPVLFAAAERAAMSVRYELYGYIAQMVHSVAGDLLAGKQLSLTWRTQRDVLQAMLGDLLRHRKALEVLSSSMKTYTTAHDRRLHFDRLLQSTAYAVPLLLLAAADDNRSFQRTKSLCEAAIAATEIGAMIDDHLRVLETPHSAVPLYVGSECRSDVEAEAAGGRADVSASVLLAWIQRSYCTGRHSETLWALLLDVAAPSPSPTNAQAETEVEDSTAAAQARDRIFYRAIGAVPFATRWWEEKMRRDATDSAECERMRRLLAAKELLLPPEAVPATGPAPATAGRSRA